MKKSDQFSITYRFFVDKNIVSVFFSRFGSYYNTLFVIFPVPATLILLCLSHFLPIRILWKYTTTSVYMTVAKTYLCAFLMCQESFSIQTSFWHPIISAPEARSPFALVTALITDVRFQNVSFVC